MKEGFELEAKKIVKQFDEEKQALTKENNEIVDEMWKNHERELEKVKDELVKAHMEKFTSMTEELDKSHQVRKT